jgi:aryl-alcohol dehydrogenase-like predicted oxidoreductase
MTATRLATNRLGATDLEVTRVGLGAWAIGGDGWEHGWCPQDDDESIAAIRYARDQGAGMLTGAMTRERVANLPEEDRRRHDRRFDEPQLSRNLDLGERFRRLGQVEPILPAATLELTDEAATEREGGAR